MMPLIHNVMQFACYKEERKGAKKMEKNFQNRQPFCTKICYNHVGRSSGLGITGIVITHMTRISTFYHHLHEQLKPVQKESIIQKQNVSCGKPHELELR
jgi:hypothetical protein